jgi:hypothetical protein
MQFQPFVYALIFVILYFSRALEISLGMKFNKFIGLSMIKAAFISTNFLIKILFFNELNKLFKLVIMLNFYQGMVSGILDIYSCEWIGDQEYVKYNKSLICDENHKSFRNKFIIPLLFFWALIPLAIFKLLYDKRKSLTSSFKTLKELGYLY